MALAGQLTPTLMRSPLAAFSIAALSIIFSVVLSANAEPTDLPTPRPVTVKVRDDGWSGNLSSIQQVNPHKTFNMDLARPGLRSYPGTKSAATSKFSFLKIFGGTREFSTSTFNSRDFLPKTSPNASKSFATETFAGSKKPFPTNSATAVNSKSGVPTPEAPGAEIRYTPPITPDASRGFSGQEADRAKLPLPPGGGPNSGIITGRQLTVDEVKAILNKSK